MVKWTQIKEFYILGTVFSLTIASVFYERYQDSAGPSILREEDLKRYEKFKQEQLEADTVIRQQNKERLGGSQQQ